MTNLTKIHNNIEQAPDTFTVEGQTLRAGTRRYPIRYFEKIDAPLPGSGKAMRYRRCRVPLENRWELSVIWGSGTYSDNYNTILGGNAEFVEEPREVEVALFYTKDGAQIMRGSDVEPYVNVEKFHAIVKWAMTLPSDGSNPGTFPGLPEGS